MTTISFARGAPCPEALSGELIAESAAAALRDDATRILSYGTGHGYPPLRELLGQQYGVPADRVLITNGSLQGFVFLLETALQQGARVAVEAPTYLGALQAFQAYQPEFLSVPIDQDGMQVDRLEEVLRRGPKFLYVLPNFQNPTGATLVLERRRRLVELAGRWGVPVVEDDPYGQLRYHGEHLPPLVQLASSERTPPGCGAPMGSGSGRA